MQIEPKYKARSHNTNLIHIEKLSNTTKIYFDMLLGDSLMENFLLEHGKKYYDALSTKKNIFNAGVGGDRIENVLYRLINGKLLEQPYLSSLFCVYLLIGTNNLHNKKDNCKDIIVGGINRIIDLLIYNLKYLKKIYVFQIPPRSDIHQDLIDAVNTKLKEFIESINIPNIEIKYISWCDNFYDGGKINPIYYCDHVHFSSLGYEVLYNRINELS